MTSIAITFTMLNALALLSLPRHWAPVPLLVGACYMTLGQEIEMGPFNFTVLRLLIAIGIIRVIIRGENLNDRINSLDWLMLFWAVWALISSFFHSDPSSALIFRLGRVYNALGIYFLLRIFCQSLDDVVRLCRITAILLIPVAAEMLYEKFTIHNLFSTLGGVSESPYIREGRIRSQGPFAHSILAGTIGAVCLPLTISIWQKHRKTAIAGIIACIIMIFASTSSGPIMSAIAAVGALWMWRFRYQMRFVLGLTIVGYVFLDLVMKAPAYYLIARLDLVGGSTGWYRVRLIESAFQHLHEWWLGGTDYTRHWMPIGATWSENHTDITNYYLHMGILGGLPLMILFIAILFKGFSFIGRALHSDNLPPKNQFMIWAFGASLFAHTITFISVSYFDQSFLFIYLTLAVISSTQSLSRKLQPSHSILLQ